MLSKSDRSNPIALRLIVALLVLAIAAVPTLPHYLTQTWPWTKLPNLPAIESLRAIEQNGLTLPDWKTPNWTTQAQQAIEVNGRTWSAQSLRAANGQQAVLLLRPQTWQRDQPQVEWTDIDGLHHWTIDSRSHLTFAAQSRSVTARWFRGWSEEQTYAVLQWYAWSTGGDFRPARWFWADQQQQWRTRDRMPWIAVCILIPVPPLSEIAPVKTEAIALGQRIQAALQELTAPESVQ